MDIIERMARAAARRRGAEENRWRDFNTDFLWVSYWSVYRTPKGRVAARSGGAFQCEEQMLNVSLRRCRIREAWPRGYDECVRQRKLAVIKEKARRAKYWQKLEEAEAA